MKHLKFTCMIATCTLFVISCKNPTGTGGTVSNISYGTYSAAVSQIWYADETTLRDFIDVATYNGDGTTSSLLYYLTGGDTLELCQGSDEWVQAGNQILYWNSSQRCKDIENPRGNYPGYSFYPDTLARTIRNVTPTSFQMQGEDPAGKQFWVEYELVEVSGAFSAIMSH